jgi:hypothetical protein
LFIADGSTLDHHIILSQLTQGQLHYIITDPGSVVK